MLAKPAAGHGLSKEKFEAFRAFGYTGSSAFTWQEATDFANHSPVGKSLVCDALGGSHDECVLGGKLTGVLGLIYDVFLADIPECSTGQAEACAGVAASVVPGGGMGKLGKAAEEAAKVAAAPKIAAAWGASVYRHGGLMSAIEHISYRHAFGSGFSGVSRFAEGASVSDVKGYVDYVLRNGTITDRGMIGDVGKVIGTDVAGNPVSGLEVIVRYGMIKTAFPVAVP